MKIVKTIQTIGLGTAVTFGSLIALTVADKATESFGLDINLVSSAEAQADNKQEKRRTPALREKTFKKLAQIEELVSPPEEEGKPAPKPNYPEALKLLDRFVKECEKEKSNCNRYEIAQLYFRYAWIYATTEDYKNSLKYYDKVIAQSPDIPLALELQSLKYMAQLAMQLEEYDRSLGYLNKWISMSSDIPADIYDLKARICYQKDDKKCALTNINKTITMRESADGGKAKEPEYNLQRALYIEKEDYKTVATIMEKLIRLYPKKSYWVQLSAVYGMLEREKDQLGTLEAAYVMGGLRKEQTMINLAYLYINAGVPFSAARVMEKGMKDKIIRRNSKNLELLARAWQQAWDTKRAIPYMSEAAEQVEKGDLYAQLVGMYLDVDDSKSAIGAANKAFKKGGLKRPGEVYLNLGIAHANLKDYKSSISSLEKAVKHKRVERMAQSWLKYIRKEYEREQALADAI